RNCGPEQPGCRKFRWRRASEIPGTLRNGAKAITSGCAESIMSSSLQCRFCESPLEHTFVDLGVSPVANDYLRADQLSQMEPFYPLHVLVCDRCWLVQLGECQTPEHIFSDHYAYFSSYSDSWLAHARNYVETVTARFELGPDSQVVEIACND